MKYRVKWSEVEPWCRNVESSTAMVEECRVKDIEIEP